MEPATWMRKAKLCTEENEKLMKTLIQKFLVHCRLKRSRNGNTQNGNGIEQPIFRVVAR